MLGSKLLLFVVMGVNAALGFGSSIFFTHLPARKPLRSGVFFLHVKIQRVSKLESNSQSNPKQQLHFTIQQSWQNKNRGVLIFLQSRLILMMLSFTLPER